MQYFSLVPDYDDEQAASIDVQHLKDDGTWHDVWMFSRCERTPSASPFSFQYEDGALRDFNVAVFNIPLVSERFKLSIEPVAGDTVQFVRANVGGEILFVMNVLTRCDALDFAKSVVTYRKADTGDQSKEVSGVIELKVDPLRANGKAVFRLKNWNIPIIVSDEIRATAVSEGITGTVFEAV